MNCERRDVRTSSCGVALKFCIIVGFESCLNSRASRHPLQKTRIGAFGRHDPRRGGLIRLGERTRSTKCSIQLDAFPRWDKGLWGLNGRDDDAGARGGAGARDPRTRAAALGRRAVLKNWEEVAHAGRSARIRERRRIDALKLRLCRRTVRDRIASRVLRFSRPIVLTMARHRIGELKCSAAAQVNSYGER